jgi:hypothetical protein
MLSSTALQEEAATLADKLDENCCMIKEAIDRVQAIQYSDADCEQVVLTLKVRSAD